MEKIADSVQQCARCGKTLRPVTSMLEPKSGRTFHMYLCECGEKSWTAQTSGRCDDQMPRLMNRPI
jgi:hypothetical protein